MPARVVIVGGGLAGIAASANLVDQGVETILIERRRFLGGRATSFHDPASNSLLDNCQHVLLGCCTELKRLYERLGVAQKIHFFDTIHFADASGRRADLYSTTAPSPLHLAPAMLRFELLSPAQKLEIARAMAAIKLMGAAGRDQLGQTTFDSWLRDQGQSPCTIARFWNVILTSALNEDVSRASARYCVQVFQEAFLSQRDAWKIGLPTVPLAEIYLDAVATQLFAGMRVASLVEKGGRVAGVKLDDGRTFSADAVIVATAPDAAARLLAQFSHRDPAVARIAELKFSPILGVHFWFDRPVMDLPHLALIGTRLQWIFRKDDSGQHLHGVISAARELIELEPPRLAEMLSEEIASLLPAAREAKLVRWRVVKERRATFCPAPGVDSLRPPQATAVPGLLLAGDYTQTGWPATMEGAVRSGLLAARAALNRL